ncbi:MAG: hypothetical protein LBU98_02830, partial [Alistipes sp.]|nr:hypothetical protein [Alistipes sp.]
LAAGASAQGLKFSGFSGGMMVHTGYAGGGQITLTDGANTFHSHISGAPAGIGGQARLHFGRHLRLGAEGYVSTLRYGRGHGAGRNQSHARTGWGGVLADVVWGRGRWSPYVGATIGGGAYRNLTLQNPTPLDNITETNASYRRYGFMMIDPFAGVEYELTRRVRLNARVDWLFNLTNRREDFATGPRLYFGFSFYRLKED